MAEESELRDVLHIIEYFPTSDSQGDHWRIYSEYGFGIPILVTLHILVKSS